MVNQFKAVWCSVGQPAHNPADSAHRKLLIIIILLQQTMLAVHCSPVWAHYAAHQVARLSRQASAWGVVVR